MNLTLILKFVTVDTFQLKALGVVCRLAMYSLVRYEENLKFNPLFFFFSAESQCKFFSIGIT